MDTGPSKQSQVLNLEPHQHTSLKPITGGDSNGDGLGGFRTCSSNCFLGESGLMPKSWNPTLTYCPNAEERNADKFWVADLAVPFEASPGMRYTQVKLGSFDTALSPLQSVRVFFVVRHLSWHAVRIKYSDEEFQSGPRTLGKHPPGVTSGEFTTRPNSEPSQRVALPGRRPHNPV